MTRYKVLYEVEAEIKDSAIFEGHRLLVGKKWNAPHYFVPEDAMVEEIPTPFVFAAGWWKRKDLPGSVFHVVSTDGYLAERIRRSPTDWERMSVTAFYE